MKYKSRFYLRVFFSMPGIIVHEFSHMVFCQIMNVRVHKVCYFRIGNPAGFVEHSRPKSFIQVFFISVGPFILGTILSLGVLFSSIYLFMRPTTLNILVAIINLWVGLSIAIGCFPSDGDGKVLLFEANHHVFQRFNPFAILIYPFVLIIKLANYLKRFYFDWIYAITLFGIATYVALFLIK